MDKNGYVPTNNKKYPQPQTNNYAKDIIFSRSKRIFSAYEGIKNILSYNGDSAIRVLYRRDTGEILWNIGAPVRLYGQQWGTFLIGVNISRIDTIKNQMLFLIIIPMSIIVVITNLVILAMIPHKYLTERIRGHKEKDSGNP